MKLLPNTIKAVGTPTDASWAQTLTIDGLSLLLSLEQSNESLLSMEIAVLGKELLVSTEEVFKSQEEKSLQQLREIATKIVAKVPKEIVFSIVLAQIKEDILYIALFGEAKAYLLRKGEIGQILHPSHEVAASSGKVEKNDIVILATKKFGELINVEELTAFFNSSPFLEGSEYITTLIHGREDAKNAAVICIKIEEVESSLEEKDTLDNSSSKFSFLSKLSLARFSFQLRSFSRRKLFIVAAGVLMAALCLSILFGFFRQKIALRGESFQETLSQAQKQYDEGAALISINPELARQPLTQAKALLEREQKLEKEDAKKKEELLAKISDLLNVSLKRYSVSPQLFFDAKVIRDAFESVGLSLSDKTMGILDKGGSIYTISLVSKAYAPIASELANPQFLTLGENAVYVLDEKGIERIDRSEKKKTLAIERSSFATIVSLVAFSSNLYALDTKESQILKFIPTDDGKLNRRTYFPEGSKLDFSYGVSMAIDGAIYVLFQDGTMRKYIEGRLDNFAQPTLDVPLKNARVVFTSKDDEFLYILDSGNKRVVVLKKNGTYEAQYSWDGIGEVTDFVASEATKKIFLLSGTKIYSIDLKGYENYQ